MIASNQKQSQSCSLCRATTSQDKPKYLYNHLICQKCYNDFANKRYLAYFIDALVLNVLALITIFVLSLQGFDFDDLNQNIELLNYSFLGFFIFKDSFGGYSPGKYLTGLQVYNTAKKKPTGFVDSFLRNFIFFIPLIPIFLAFQLRKGLRFGDGIAKTKVIWKKYEKEEVFRV